MDSKDVMVIVLAAGEAKRMGRPKQLLRHQGKTLLQMVIQNVLSLKLPLLVVLGAHRDEIGRSLAEYDDITMVENLHWKEGISSSIRCGIQAVLKIKDDPIGVLITLADQPEITPEHLTVLKDKGIATCKMVATKYRNTLGVPAYFPNHCFESLMQLKGDQGARSLFTAQPEQVMDITFEPAALDIDTEQDWRDFIGG